MKTFIQSIKIILCVCAPILFAACGMGGGGGDAAALSDYDSVIYKPVNASGFEILGAPGAKSTILRVTNPWQGADGVTCSLFIARDGENAPKGFDGQVIDGDAARVVCMSSTHVAMLDMLGDVGAIVGISSPQFVHNAHVQANLGSIADVGYDGNINYEAIVASRPDIVLLYAIAGRSELENKLTELGIPFAYLGDYLEESPAGKAEWLVAAAEIVGRRDEAIAIYDSIPQRYDAIKEYAASLGDRPKVMINTPYADSWLMASRSSYIARLIADAGGEYVYRGNDSNRSMPIDIEEAYLLANSSDYWINTGASRSFAELTTSFPRFADVKPVRSGNVYNCNRRLNSAGGNDFWESATLRPDVVLRDLVKIFHPGEFPADTLVYYQQLK